MLLLPLIACLINAWLQGPLRSGCSSPMITKMPTAVETSVWVYPDLDATLCYLLPREKKAVRSQLLLKDL